MVKRNLELRLYVEDDNPYSGPISEKVHVIEFTFHEMDDIGYYSVKIQGVESGYIVRECTGSDWVYGHPEEYSYLDYKSLVAIAEYINELNQK